MSRPRTSRLSSAPRAFRLPPPSAKPQRGDRDHAARECVRALSFPRPASLSDWGNRCGAPSLLSDRAPCQGPHTGALCCSTGTRGVPAGAARVFVLNDPIQPPLRMSEVVPPNDTRLRGATPCTRHAHRATLLPMSYSTMDPPWRGATYADGSGIGAEDVSRVEVVDEPDWYGVGVAFAGTAERHAYGIGVP